MIINEKYLMDIDDDDDDIITSSSEFNNRKDLKYDFAVETYNATMLMQYSARDYGRNNLKLCSLRDCVEYYEYVQDIVDDNICVKDYYIRATFSHMDNDYTTDDMTAIPMDTVYEGQTLSVPVILLKFNVNEGTRYKEFYQLLQTLQNCVKQFVKKFDYRRNYFTENNEVLILNETVITQPRDVLYKARPIFNSVMKKADEQGILPKRLNLKYNGNTRHISPNSEKSVDEFEFGDILYATSSGELVSQASSDGQKHTPIAICTLSREKDHRFISLNYMSRMNTYTGTKRQSSDTEIPFGAKSVLLKTVNAPGIGWDGALLKQPLFYDITGEKDFETCLEYMNTCYNHSSRRACPMSMYFDEHLPFTNMKGILPAVLCVNRFRTLGTESGDWYLPCQAEIYMFTHMEIDGYDRAYKKINEVRASVGYKPMVGIAPSPCEMDKNSVRCGGLDDTYNSWRNKDDEFTVLAMLRITD